MFLVPGIGIVVGRGCCELQGAEGARVYITLHFKHPAYKLCVRCEHAHAPAGHVVALAHGVEFYAAVLCARHLQDAEPFAGEDKAVRIVVDDDKAFASRQFHRPLVRSALRRRAGGHVRVVHPQDTHAAVVGEAFEFFKVGLPAVFGAQAVRHHLATEQFGERGVSGVAGIWHEHLVAHVGQRERGVEDAFFRTDERLDFAVGVERHAEPAAVKSSHGRAQFFRAHRGLVAVPFGAFRLAAERFDRFGRRRQVGAAYGERDNVCALRPHLRHLLEFS